MKRLLVLILVWTLLVVTGTIVSADGQTRHRHKRHAPLQSSQVKPVWGVITDVTS